MQIHNLQSGHPGRRARQVGRGGKRGKTSGRGTKGQLARAGRKLRPELRDIIKKLPKLRGRGRNFLKSRQKANIAVNLSQLEKVFSAGDTVTRASLISKKVITIKKSD